VSGCFVVQQTGKSEGKKLEGKEVKRDNIPEINFSVSGPRWVIHIPQTSCWLASLTV